MPIFRYLEVVFNDYDLMSIQSKYLWWSRYISRLCRLFSMLLNSEKMSKRHVERRCMCRHRPKPGRDDVVGQAAPFTVILLNRKGNRSQDAESVWKAMCIHKHTGQALERR